MENLKVRNRVLWVVLALVAVLGVGYGVYAYTQAQVINVSGDYNNYEAKEQVSDVSFGAFSGPDVYSDVNIYGALTTGSNKQLATTTDAKTYTLTFKDLDSYTYLDILNSDDEAALSWTLPATSTMMQILPEVGSSREWLFHHASTTGGTLTLVKGAGMDVIAVTANDDVIDPGEYTRLTCTQIHYRGADDENIACIVDELTNAD